MNWIKINKDNLPDIEINVLAYSSISKHCVIGWIDVDELGAIYCDNDWGETLELVTHYCLITCPNE